MAKSSIDRAPRDTQTEVTYKAGTKNFYTAAIPSPTIAFPSDLQNNMTDIPFIHLNVVESVASTPRTQYALGLPFPTSVKTSYNANWETIDLGAIAGAAVRATESGNVLGSTAEDKFGNMAKGVAGAIVANALDKVGYYSKLNVRAATEVASRIMVNQHAALRFMGMSFREFILEFQLFPKNQKDSRAIQDIIFQLKYAMHPKEYGAGAATSAYFEYPNSFIIGFYAPNLKFLFRTSPCALLNLNVEYAGGGVPAFHRDDSPVAMVLGLHFKENEILTKTRIEQGW